MKRPIKTLSHGKEGRGHWSLELALGSEELLKLLKKSAKDWNKWRKESQIERPFFGIVDLEGAYLGEVNLYSAHLTGARLNKANLNNADLREARLEGAQLNNAVLSNARLNYADLDHAELTNANCRRADFYNANLKYSDLSNADLRYANLTFADLRFSNLNGANLKNTKLSYADLSGADIINTDIGGAEVGWTHFADNNLSTTKGLDTVYHIGPSEISIRTIYQSEGKIAEVFLRGCGVPDEFTTYMRSLVANPIQFYSCFISYSSKDQDFANRLYADLQNKGVRCWFAPEDLKIGDKIRDRIDESIRLRDKLLLILTESSIASDWVEHEVESAIEEERQRGRTILFPIRLDEAVMESSKAWAGLIRRTRHIGDFTRWKDHDSYQKAFDRLLRDLKAEG